MVSIAATFRTGRESDAPIPSIRANDSLIIRQFGPINHSCTSALDKIYKTKQRSLLFLTCQRPEALPRYPKRSISECITVGQELTVATVGCFVYLGRGVIVARIDTIDGVEGVDGISDRSGKCSDSVLMGAFWDDAIIVSAHAWIKIGRRGSNLPSSRSQPDCRLNANQCVPFRRVDDYSIRLTSVLTHHPLVLEMQAYHYHQSRYPARTYTNCQQQHQRSRSCSRPD